MRALASCEAKSDDAPEADDATKRNPAHQARVAENTARVLPCRFRRGAAAPGRACRLRRARAATRQIRLGARFQLAGSGYADPRAILQPATAAASGDGSVESAPLFAPGNRADRGPAMPGLWPRGAGREPCLGRRGQDSALRLHHDRRIGRRAQRLRPLTLSLISWERGRSFSDLNARPLARAAGEGQGEGEQARRSQRRCPISAIEIAGT